jgi:hypothetical protein
MIRFADESQPAPQPVSADRLRHTIEQALPLARQRANLALQVRAALESGDTAEALRLTREYVGLPPTE